MTDKPEPVSLDDEIIQAHHDGDRHLLGSLYLKAAQLKETEGDVDAACFLFTQAYVFSLDSGNQCARDAARARLVAHGRET